MGITLFKKKLLYLLNNNELMNDFYLKRLRKEADTYYHIRLNESGKYDIFFHNYQLTKVESNLSRQEAFERLKVHKRKHILKRVKQLKKN